MRYIVSSRPRIRIGKLESSKAMTKIEGLVEISCGLSFIHNDHMKIRCLKVKSSFPINGWNPFTQEIKIIRSRKGHRIRDFAAKYLQTLFRDDHNTWYKNMVEY